jgi:uncharacterized membrane protein YczE
VLFLFRGAVFEGGVFHKRDIHLVWHPQVEGFVHAVAAGAWPVWDPAPGFGQPLLADPSAQIFYPPTWLNLLMRPWIYYTVFIVGHTLFSAFGFYLLARRFQLSALASTLAAGIWITSGPFISYLDLWHHFTGATWIPWVVLAADAAFEAPGVRGVLLWGAAMAAQILSGSADMTALTLVTVATCVLLRRIRWERQALAANGRLMGVAAASGALALGLSAALWLPALELVSRSARSSLPEAIRTYWSVHPMTLFECLTPSLWAALPLNEGMRQALFEGREPFLFDIYLGLPAVALVAAGVAFGASRLRWPLVGLVAGSVLVALGRHTPAYAIAVFVLPVLKVLRYPVKAMILVAFGWSLLTGMGLDAWLRTGPVPRHWRSRVALPAFGLGLLALCSVFYAMNHATALAGWLLVTETDAASLLRPTVLKLSLGAAFALSAAALALCRWRWPARWPGLALAVLSLGDLTALHRHPSPLAPVALYAHRPEVLDSLKQAQRIYVYDYSRGDKALEHLGAKAPTLALVPEGWPLIAAVDLASQLALVPASSGRWGVRSGFEPDARGLYPHYASQMSSLVRVYEDPPLLPRLLRLGGVTHVIALHERGFESLKLVASVPGMLKEPIRVFEVPNPLPRAFLVGGASVHTDLDVIATLKDPTFEPSTEVLLAAGHSLPPHDVGGSVAIVEDRADKLVLEASLSQPGYLVLLDSYDPNWHARVDGRATTLERANLAFRALELSPGRHHIELRYWPWALSLGLGISAASIAALLLAWRRFAAC